MHVAELHSFEFDVLQERKATNKKGLTKKPWKNKNMFTIFVVFLYRLFKSRANRQSPSHDSCMTPQLQLPRVPETATDAASTQVPRNGQTQTNQHQRAVTCPLRAPATSRWWCDANRHVASSCATCGLGYCMVRSCSCRHWPRVFFGWCGGRTCHL